MQSSTFLSGGGGMVFNNTIGVRATDLHDVLIGNGRCILEARSCRSMRAVWTHPTPGGPPMLPAWAFSAGSADCSLTAPAERSHAYVCVPAAGASDRDRVLMMMVRTIPAIPMKQDDAGDDVRVTAGCGALTFDSGTAVVVSNVFMMKCSLVSRGRWTVAGEFLDAAVFIIRFHIAAGE
jgi:hypothetical protein